MITEKFGDIFFKYGFLKKLFDVTGFVRYPLLLKSVEVNQNFIRGQ